MPRRLNFGQQHRQIVREIQARRKAADAVARARPAGAPAAAPPPPPPPPPFFIHRFLQRERGVPQNIARDAVMWYATDRNEPGNIEAVVAKLAEFREWLAQQPGGAQLAAAVAVQFKVRGRTFWRHSGWFSAGFPDPRNPAGLELGEYADEQEGVEDFEVVDVVFNTRPVPRAGGTTADRANNCLLENIEYAARSALRTLPFGLDQDRFRNVRRQLGVQQGAPIPCDQLPAVEELSGWRIPLMSGGELVYAGHPDRRRPTAMMELTSAGHYTLQETRLQKWPEQAQRFALDDFAVPRAPLVAQRTEGKLGMVYSDRQEPRKEKLNRLRFNPKAVVRTAERDDDPEQMLAAWKEERAQMLAASGGKVDTFSRGTAVEMGLDTWLAMSTTLAEEFPAEQQAWMSDAMMGGLIRARPGHVENAVEADVNSFYSYLMQRKTGSRIPIVPGQFVRRMPPTEFCKQSADLWRINVTNVPEPFRANRHGIYREAELATLCTAGATVDRSAECDVLHWDRDDCVEAHTLFKRWLDWWGVFEAAAREKKLPLAVKYCKNVRNSLWGRLSMRSRSIQIRRNGDCLNECLEIEEMTPFGNGLRVVLRNTNRGAFAGLLPSAGVAITSMGRVWMGSRLNWLDKNGFQWRRVHTDGVVVDLGSRSVEELADVIKISGDVGDFKISHRGCATVYNAMRVGWGN